MRIVMCRIIPVVLALLLSPAVTLGAATRQGANQERQLDLSQPLGTPENPVRTPRGGQPPYLQRLRCPDGEPPTLGGRGSVGMGPYGNIIDVWSITCGEAKHSVYMDHYHNGYQEDRPVPGFRIASRHTPQLIVEDGLLYRFGDDAPFSGEVTDLHDGGETSAEMTVVNGLIEGTLTRFHEDGRPSLELHFVNGREHGPFLSYYADGVRAREGTYRDGLLDGVMASYDRSGGLREALTYREGRPNGEGIRWDEQGEETQRAWFFDGQPVPASVADTQGLERIDFFKPFLAPPGEELWDLALSVGDGISAPLKVHDVDPEFPAEGDPTAAASVVFDVVIATDGRVGAVRIATSSGSSLLDEAAAAALRQWRYEPTIVGAKAVPVSMSVSVDINGTRLAGIAIGGRSAAAHPSS